MKRDFQITAGSLKFIVSVQADRITSSQIDLIQGEIEELFVQGLDYTRGLLKGWEQHNKGKLKKIEITEAEETPKERSVRLGFIG